MIAKDYACHAASLPASAGTRASGAKGMAGGGVVRPGDPKNFDPKRWGVAGRIYATQAAVQAAARMEQGAGGEA